MLASTRIGCDPAAPPPSQMSEFSMRARIYRPAKSAMQAGRARANQWVLEYEPIHQKESDKLMGWTSSFDTKEQVRLQFETADDAIRYAVRHGLDYSIISPSEKSFKQKSYAGNFDKSLKVPWTH